MLVSILGSGEFRGKATSGTQRRWLAVSFVLPRNKTFASCSLGIEVSCASSSHRSRCAVARIFEDRRYDYRNTSRPDPVLHWAELKWIVGGMTRKSLKSPV